MCALKPEETIGNVKKHRNACKSVLSAATQTFSLEDMVVAKTLTKISRGMISI